MMGHGMALNILKAGHPVTVMAHRNRAPIDDLVRNGAAEAPDPALVAERSDVVILVLPNGRRRLRRDRGRARPSVAAGPRGLVVGDVTTRRTPVRDDRSPA